MKKSIYKYAAEAGVPIGIYLSAMSACLLLSLRVEFLPSLIIPLAIGFPVLLLFILKRIAQKEPQYVKISALWLGGIYSVIFGTLICMLFSAAYIIFAEPAFVYKYFSATISYIENSPLKEEYATTVSLMRDAIDARILPSGMEFIMTMGWTTCFAGSILSLVFATIIAGSNRDKADREMSGNKRGIM